MHYQLKFTDTDGVMHIWRDESQSGLTHMQ